MDPPSREHMTHAHIKEIIETGKIDTEEDIFERDIIRLGMHLGEVMKCTFLMDRTKIGHNDPEPLLVVLVRRYKNNANDFLQVQELVKTGVNVNDVGRCNRTALYLALLKEPEKADFELIKYLYDNGADIGHVDDFKLSLINSYIFFLKKECKTLTIRYIQEFATPVFKLFIESNNGDHFFKNDPNCESSLHQTFGFDKFTLVAGATYDDSMDCYTKFYRQLFGFIFEQLNQRHLQGIDINPELACILKNYHAYFECNRKSLLLKRMFFKYFKNEFKTCSPFTIEWEESIDTFQSVSLNFQEIKMCVIGSAFAFGQIEKLKKYIPFLETQFVFQVGPSYYTVLLARKMKKKSEEILIGTNQVVKLFKFLSAAGHKVWANNNVFQYTFHIPDFKLPDCIWLAAYQGCIESLKCLLPEWTGHPLTVILYIRPWLEQENEQLSKKLLYTIAAILPFLIEMGGPFPHGSTLYKEYESYISKCEEECEKFRKTERPIENSASIFPIRKAEYFNHEHNKVTKFELYDYIIKLLNDAHEEVSDLLFLARNAFRKNLNSELTNLASVITGLTYIPKELEKFVALQGKRPPKKYPGPIKM